MKLEQKQKLHVVMDGDFNFRDGKAVSNRNHYEIFSKRYTSVFEETVIHCRVHNVVDVNGKEIEGPGVEVAALPSVHGIAELIYWFPKIIQSFWSIPKNSPVLLRVPGIFPSIAWIVMMLKGQRYCVEAMADAAAQFSEGAYRGRLRSFYGPIWTWLMRKQCAHASAASYVTREALQRAYPASRAGYETNYTTLDLGRDKVVASPRQFTPSSAPLRVVNVAMMQKHLKGQDIILNAVALLDDLDVELWLVGDGENRLEFERLAERLGLANRVKFLGRLDAGQAVMDVLDECDLFVLPSRQEGLPRVLIEAMARGLPCLSSDLPGSRELLSEEFLVRPNLASAWADKLAKIIGDRETLSQMSRINIERCQEYVVDHVQERRKKFYEYVKKMLVN
ncbi:glycosyltransferase [Rhizobium sp. L43]|uniref:glycosyltransferase family 4 protein n=1 Tax=Rhizobium sp. L43 TaxID=2035452 RepID=UPI000BE89019|nr:glycosyltransferase [Rhizobium sp. L43]PDS76360.1 hypothetical protein CO667_22410 [Rhizobium sp. L43]